MTRFLTASGLRRAGRLAALGSALASLLACAPANAQPGRDGGGRDPGGRDASMGGTADGPTGSLGRPDQGPSGVDRGAPGNAPSGQPPAPGIPAAAMANRPSSEGPRTRYGDEPDQDLARAAASRGMAVSLDRVLQKTASVAPGDVLDVRLRGLAGGSLTYEIRVLSGDGLIRTVLIDASRNEIIEVRRPR